MPHQHHQRKQLLDPEERAALRQHDEGVDPDYVSPRDEVLTSEEFNI